MRKLGRVNSEQLRLYLVTDTQLCRGRSLGEVVSAAVRGGVTCVQLREKTADIRDFISKANALHPLLHDAGIPLVINDRLDVALVSTAEGLHLGQSDLPAAEARRLLPDSVFIGLSVESLEDLDAASDLDVDYLAISPIFSTSTKVDTKMPWGLEGLRLARRRTDLPLVAIGGIQAEIATQVLAAGADGLAVVSAICGADDPEAAALEFARLVGARSQP